MFISRYYSELKIAFIAFVSIFCFFFPEIVFNLIHALIVQLFEILEGALDEVVEHFFHTDRHTTQMIVFYLMWTMFIFCAYQLARKLQVKLYKLRAEFEPWRQIQIAKLNTTWQELFHHQFKYLMLLSGVGTLCMGYLFL